MDRSLVPRELEPRLRRLNQEIESGLAQVRRRRQELEDVERSTAAAAPRSGLFLELLRRSLDGDSASPETGSPRTAAE